MLCLVIRRLLNLYLFRCIYCHFQRQETMVRSFCKECGVYLCLCSGRNCFLLYHNKTKLSMSCREFASSKKVAKSDFTCFTKKE